MTDANQRTTQALVHCEPTTTWLAGLIGLVLGLTLSPQSVFGHSLYLFTTVEGEQIVGRVYLRGGTGIGDVAVKIYRDGQQVVSEVRTDRDGRFTFRPPCRGDYLFRAVTADGHTAEGQIAASDLPTTQPPCEGAQNASQPKQGQPSQAERPSTAVGHATESPPQSSSTSNRDGLHADGSLSETSPSDDTSFSDQSADHSLSREIASLRTQVVKLREDLQAFQSAVRIRDVLGGIGYILGLMGVAFYVAGRKHRAPGDRSSGQQS